MAPHRIYWFQSDLGPDLLARIGAGMLSNSYAKGRSWGFRLDTVRPSEIKGNFVERNEYEDKVKEPTGELHVFKGIQIRTTHFRLSSRFPQIEIVDPSPSYRRFLSQMSVYADFSVAMESPNVDVGKWIAEIERRTSDFRIAQVDVSNIPLSTSMSVALKFSGDICSDYQNAVYRAAGRRCNFLINSVVAEWSESGNRIRAHLHRLGRILTRSQQALPTIKESMQTALISDNDVEVGAAPLLS